MKISVIKTTVVELNRNEIIDAVLNYVNNNPELQTKFNKEDLSFKGIESDVSLSVVLEIKNYSENPNDM